MGLARRHTDEQTQTKQYAPAAFWLANVVLNYTLRSQKLLSSETKNCETFAHFVRAKALVIVISRPTMNFFYGGLLIILNFQSNLDEHSELW